MISHKHKIIFIHIPKCAGTSIERALGHYDIYCGRNKQDHRTVRNLKPKSYDLLSPLISNINYNKKIILNKLGRKYKSNPKNTLKIGSKQYDCYFKFTFVRNPWDRVLSWYRNVLRDPMHQNKLGVTSEIRFDEFLYRFCNTGQLRPQLHWLNDENDAVELDYVGKFESLAQDFTTICSMIGLDGVSLPHEMNGGLVRYQDYYDAKLRNFVADQYAEEIELFDYEY